MQSGLIARASGLIDRLVAALTGAHKERAILWVLAAYWALWSVYGAISKASQDIHFDMGEAVVWAHESLAGNPKHPPLSAWIVRVWFSVFPQTDWAYYTLSILMAVIGLYAAWKVSARFLSGEKRVAAVALLMLVPFFNFHALKYNANAVMIPLWALCTWAFIVSFETRWPLPAALAGLAAAAAMLGKYWSIILLVSLGIAALTHPGRRQYFRSPAPYVTIAVGALAPADALQLTVTTNGTSLLASRDRRTETVRDMLHRFKLDSGVKAHIDRDLPRLLNGEIALLGYRGLSDAQRSALGQVLGERVG